MKREVGIILIFFGVFLACFLTETYLRIKNPPVTIYQEDKATQLIILKPGKEFSWTKNCFKNSVKTNSLGFHDYEFSKEKSENSFRIAIIGDSYVESLQVPLEKTFHKLLENQLNKELKSNEKFEVYTFGHSGNGTFLNYLYLKNYAFKYKPDLVIDAFLIGNDFRDDSSDLTKEFVSQTGDTAPSRRPFAFFDREGNVHFLVNKGESSAIEKTASKSPLLHWLYQKYHLIKLKFSKQIPVDFQVFLKDYSPVWSITWQKEEELLRAMKKLSNENNVKFILISLAEGHWVHNSLHLSKEYPSYVFDMKKPENLLQKISQRQQFPYLALTPIFQERFKRENKMTTFSCDGHWNETGHQWAAEAIFAFLKDHSNLLSKN